MSQTLNTESETPESKMPELPIKEDGSSSSSSTLVPKVPNLPPEVVEEILARVPAKPLARFRCINKSWNSLLTTNFTFIKKQIAQALKKGDSDQRFVFHVGSCEFFSAPKSNISQLIRLFSIGFTRSAYLQVVASSHGLICITDSSYPDYGSNIYLWNPSNGNCKTLPEFDSLIKPTGANPSMGFGFQPTTFDYKLVRLVNFEEKVDGKRVFKVEVSVYSLRSNSWRRLGHFPYRTLPFNSRAFLNGCVHWGASSRVLGVNRREGGGNHREARPCDFILAFDMATETFREVDLPADYNDKVVSSLHLRTFRGCLALLAVIGRKDMHVWIMKEYGVKASWTKLFIMPRPPYTYPIPVEFLENGDLLLDICDERWGFYVLVSYNAERKQIRQLEVIGEEGRGFPIDVVHYTESLAALVSPHYEAMQVERNRSKIGRRGLPDANDPCWSGWIKTGQMETFHIINTTIVGSEHSEEAESGIQRLTI